MSPYLVRFTRVHCCYTKGQPVVTAFPFTSFLAYLVCSEQLQTDKQTKRVSQHKFKKGRTRQGRKPKLIYHEGVNPR